MENDIKVITTYNNDKVQLVFNERFLGLNQDCIIDIELGAKVFNWKFRMVFDNIQGTVPFETRWEINVDDVHIKATFHNWITTSWLEMSKPHLVKTKDGSKIYFKVRSQASTTLENIRTIDLSIWKVII